MGTFYKIFDQENPIEGEFGIDEMSNRLSFVYSDNVGREDWKSTKEMIPKEMAKKLIYCLQVCSYWMDREELIELIKTRLEDF